MSIVRGTIMQNQAFHRIGGVPAWAARALAVALFVVVTLVAGGARAAVKREGAWPADADTRVSLDVSRVPRLVAVRKLADAAGWSVVVQGASGGDTEDLVDVHVKDQPAAKVLDLVLDDGWIASRDGTLVSLRRAPDASAAPAVTPDVAPAPPAPEAQPTPAAPPAIPAAPHGIHAAKSAKGEDRVVTGSNLVIAKDEMVHDVAVFGGSLEVLGTVTGDVSVTGGSITIRSGARVKGDVAGVGGSITIEDGAEVEGDVGVVGGAVHKGEHAEIGGDVSRADLALDRDASEHPGGREKLRSAVRAFGSAATRGAFLFIFGAILLALGTRRMETMRAEVASRPMRALAVGVVALLVGSIALVVLCVTLIGIPVAVIGALVATFGGYAGAIAVLTTLGEALLRHRTQNTYVHLAIGCALFFFASALPFVGHFVTLALVLLGFGVFVGTRAAGYWPEKKTPGAGPYRTAA